MFKLTTERKICKIKKKLSSKKQSRKH